MAEGLGLIVTWAMTHTQRRANIATAVRSTLLMRNITAWFAASTPAYEAMIAFNPGNGEEPDVEKLPAVLALMHVAVNVAGLPKWDDARDHAKVVYNQLVTMFKQARDKTVRAKLQAFVEKETARLAEEAVIQFKKHESNPKSSEAWRPTLPKGEWKLLQALLGMTATGCRDLMLKNPDTMYCVIDSLSEMWKDSASSDSDEDEAVVPTDVDIAALTSRVEAAETRVREALATATGAEQIAEATETGVAAMTKRFAALEKRAAAAERRAAEADKRADEADEKMKTMQDTIDEFRKTLKAVVVDVADLSSPPTPPPPPQLAAPTTPTAPPPPPPKPRVSNDIVKRITAMEHQVSWIIPQIHMQFCSSWNAAHSQWHLMNVTGNPHVPMPSLE